MEALLAKIGWALGLIAAAAGSAFSLFIDPQKTKEMRTLTIWMTMLYGAGIGFLFGGVVAAVVALGGGGAQRPGTHRLCRRGRRRGRR